MAAKRQRFDRNSDPKYIKERKRILATAEVCAICGRPLDKTLIYPHPLSPTVDHIIPIARGGSNHDPGNLQAVHLICNVKKGDNMPGDDEEKKTGRKKTISNRILPLSMDWRTYKG